MTKNDGETQCCPTFDPEPWHDKEITWENKLFVKDTVMQFMHMPLPGTFSRTVGRMWKRIEEAGATPDTEDFLLLAAESSPWKGEIYISVTKEIPNAENVRLSGTYITKVFDGLYNAVPKCIKEMNQCANRKGQLVRTHYFYYTTCPKCARTYGHDCVVAFAEV